MGEIAGHSSAGHMGNTVAHRTAVCRVLEHHRSENRDSAAGSVLPGRYQRKAPYLYDDDEIQNLLRAARSMHSPTGLRAWTYETLLAMLAVTGYAAGEALALTDATSTCVKGCLQSVNQM